MSGSSDAPSLSGGGVIWLTGLPASGKTTVARILLRALRARGAAVVWLDSDDLRPWLTPAPSYDDAERERFYGALGHLATLAGRGGAWAVVSATAHRRAWRDAVRAQVPRFCEVWLRCPLPVLRARDPKGLYGAAHADATTRLPGVGVGYEAPSTAEVVVDTDQQPAEAVVERVMAWLDA